MCDILYRSAKMYSKINQRLIIGISNWSNALRDPRKNTVQGGQRYSQVSPSARECSPNIAWSPLVLPRAISSRCRLIFVSGMESPPPRPVALGIPSKGFRLGDSTNSVRMCGLLCRPTRPTASIVNVCCRPGILGFPSSLFLIGFILGRF